MVLLVQRPLKLTPHLHVEALRAGFNAATFYPLSNPVQQKAGGKYCLEDLSGLRPTFIDFRAFLVFRMLFALLLFGRVVFNKQGGGAFQRVSCPLKETNPYEPI